MRGLEGPILHRILRWQVNRLESFYPPNSQQLNQVFAAVDRVDFRAMAQRYSMPLELATDMVSAKGCPVWK